MRWHALTKNSQNNRLEPYKWEVKAHTFTLSCVSNEAQGLLPRRSYPRVTRGNMAIAVRLDMNPE